MERKARGIQREVDGINTEELQALADELFERLEKLQTAFDDRINELWEVHGDLTRIIEAIRERPRD